MPSDNIFSALAKYNSTTDENYLTESFVFLINLLLKRERNIGIDIIDKLCVNNNEFSFIDNENLSVSTQEFTEQGTPDIKICTPNKLIYIEVKHKSFLGYKQIERYKEALRHSSAPIKQVVLLTRYPVDFKNEDEKPYKHVRWYEVYNWLASAKGKTQDNISIYLIKEFMAFLEVKQMSMQKVGWEYIKGIPEMLNMMNIIENAIQAAGLKLYTSYPRAVALEWRGFYIESNILLCGILFSSPLYVFFQICNKTGYNKDLLKNPIYEIVDDKHSIWIWLDLEKHHFFSLNKDEQLELVTSFVKTAYVYTQKMRVS